MSRLLNDGVHVRGLKKKKRGPQVKVSSKNTSTGNDGRRTMAYCERAHAVCCSLYFNALSISYVLIILLPPQLDGNLEMRKPLHAVRRPCHQSVSAFWITKMGEGDPSISRVQRTWTHEKKYLGMSSAGKL